MATEPRLPTRVQLSIGTIGAGVLAVFIVLGVVAYVGQAGLKENRRATRCVLDQLVEHRASSLVHEYQAAGEHGDQFVQPDGVNAPSKEAIDAAVRDLMENCRHFLPGNLEQLEPPAIVVFPTTTTTVGPGSPTTIRPRTTLRQRGTPPTIRRRSSSTTATTRPTSTSRPFSTTPPTSSPPCTIPLPQLCGGLS